LLLATLHVVLEFSGSLVPNNVNGKISSLSGSKEQVEEIVEMTMERRSYGRSFKAMEMN